MFSMENEDDDPVGPRDPLARFTALAVEVGLIAPGEMLQPEAVDFAHRLVELCAWLAKWGEFDTQNIIPHRQVVAGHTDCPGFLADRMDDLRQAAHDRKVELLQA